jgi:hypothetical protein
MKKNLFSVTFLLFFLSNAFAADLKSIKEFEYQSISFSSSMDDLKSKGFECKDKMCTLSDESFTYDPGLLSADILARNGKSVIFHENHPIKIIIDQLYPDTGELCQGIMTDLQSRFNDKYKADINFTTYSGRFGPSTDYNSLYGSVKLGEDILRVGFSCNKVKKPDSNEKFTFIHALFDYENLASRLLIDNI